MSFRSALCVSFTVYVSAVAADAAADPPGWPAPMFPDSGAFGVVVHTAFKAQALHDVNAQWVRVSVRWKNVEVESKGNYDWTESDRLLNYYLDDGFRVMCVLTMERLCPLYEADKADKEAVIAAIARWCGAMAERYAGKGILWELSNEPEVFPMDGYWNDPVTYTKMAKQCARAIKMSDPHAKVAALSVAWMDKGFIETSLKEGLLADGTVDVITYHGYHRHTLLPESGLAEDVAWLREQIAQHAPPEHRVIVADSERGYAIVPMLEKKAWHSWRNLTYFESEQAAYCARHYLETIFLGVEIAVWYKDMRGEHAYSLYYGTEEDERGLRPMGHVYRNLAGLLPDNPKSLRNDRYTLSVAASDSPAALEVRSYLRTSGDGERLIAAVWNPVEAFEDRILDNRKRVGEFYYEAWRAVSEEDVVHVPATLCVEGLSSDALKSVRAFDLLSPSTEEACRNAEWRPGGETSIEIPVVASPMPAIIVLDMK